MRNPIRGASDDPSEGHVRIGARAASATHSDDLPVTEQAGHLTGHRGGLDQRAVDRPRCERVQDQRERSS
jgi:hypothetical protein